MMSTRRWLFDQNIVRVNNLISVFSTNKKSPKRHSVAEADVLRAAVVFLHAAFEDYLRDVLVQLLPIYGGNELSNIALLGNAGRTEKFTIANLCEYSSLTVCDLIEQSVKEHMKKVSFNSVTEIVSRLRSVKIDTSALSSQDNIEIMIERRHSIVHQVDKSSNTGRGNFRAAPIAQPTVEEWRNTVISWVNHIDKELERLTSSN